MKIKHSSLFKDLLEVTKDGEWGKAESQGNDQKMLVVRGKDFSSVRFGNFAEVPVRFIADRHAQRKTLQANDILIETAGGTKGRPTGRTIYLKERFFDKTELPVTCASFSRFLRINADLATPAYVYWYLQFLYEAKQIEQYQIQHTGLARFQYTRFAESIEIPLPSNEEQEKIADTLSAYDDLIENNDRRIALLEESVHLLYREWFVNLRFPGCDGGDEGAISNGIPDGWQEIQLKELATLNYGKALKKADRVPGPYPVFGSSGIVGYHNKHLVEAPGIVIGRKGNVGSIYWSDISFYPIDTVYFVDKSESSYFLYHTLKNLNFISSDVAVPGLNRNYAYSLRVVFPKTSIVEKFEDFATPVHQQIQRLNAYNQRLREARDGLLPRLMNGSIAV